MTISEATAVNTLISALFGPQNEHDKEESPEAVAKAASYLADRAYKPLMSGWDGKRVLERAREVTT